MSVKMTTKFSDIQSYLEREIERREQIIIRHFRYVGESCVKEARDAGNYIDRTGNLRSSVGYVIVKDGVIVESNGFEQVKTGSEGIKSGAAYARTLAAQYPKGIALIVVAGMKYAAAVESRGKNVLTSAELLAKQLVPRIMKKLGFKAA